MKYIKPQAQIVELSVKESLSALFKQKRTLTFGFGSQTPSSKEIDVNLYTANSISQVDYKIAEEA